MFTWSQGLAVRGKVSLFCGCLMTRKATCSQRLGGGLPCYGGHENILKSLLTMITPPWSDKVAHLNRSQKDRHHD